MRQPLMMMAAEGAFCGARVGGRPPATLHMLVDTGLWLVDGLNCGGRWLWLSHWAAIVWLMAVIVQADGRDCMLGRQTAVVLLRNYLPALHAIPR